MKHTDTVNQIDKAIHLYKWGLLSIYEAFNRIDSIIIQYSKTLDGNDINIVTAATNKLYRNALNKLYTVLKNRIKYN